MLKSYVLLMCTLLTFSGLSGCGGSSSNNSDEMSPQPIALAPTVTLVTTDESIETNSEFTLTWSSSNASSCSASGDWSGDKITSGSEIINESNAGTKTYTLSCSGAGGESSSSINVDIIGNDENVLWDYTDIIYGDDDPSRQWLNIHLAYDQSKPSPIYLYAHANGGSANGMNEKELHTIANEGYATISWESISTLTNPEDTAIAIHDAQVMFEWVLANADTYNLDPNHIVIGGRSRGSIISWQLAHSNHPSIKGIYMYNALPKSAWQNTETWNPADEVTLDSPHTLLVYGPDFDDEDGHNPSFVEPVLARYDELEISDRITRYVDMWGDFQDSNGNWTNDGQTMHYFPEMVAIIDEDTAPPVAGYNTLFMGHSFFAPIARQIPFHMTQLGIDDHNQYVEFSGGASGTPLSLWENEGHRSRIQATLDTGNIDIFGMTFGDADGYVKWIDYALSKNPNTKIVIGIPWLDYPANYEDADSYESRSNFMLQTTWSSQRDTLRVQYPNIEIISLPYGLAAIQLRHMFEGGELPGVDELIGNDLKSSIYKDQKGHGHQAGLLLDLSEFIWLSHIYGIDLEAYDYSAGHTINLKEVANLIIENNAYYFQ